MHPPTPHPHIHTHPHAHPHPPPQAADPIDAVINRVMVTVASGIGSDYLTWQLQIEARIASLKEARRDSTDSSSLTVYGIFYGNTTVRGGGGVGGNSIWGADMHASQLHMEYIHLECIHLEYIHTDIYTPMHTHGTHTH